MTIITTVEPVRRAKDDSEPEHRRTKHLLRLIADENFVLLENLASRPNIIKILGRTHTETWHSMFLGWLLDPRGSHGLGDFPLRRLLSSLVADSVVHSQPRLLEEIIHIAALGDFNRAHVVPNEYEQKEATRKSSHFDVLVTDRQQKVAILIEQKVGANVDKHQCQTYIKWFDTCEEFQQFTRIPILLVPHNKIGETSYATTGSDRWFIVDYQLIHDDILIPSLTHAELNPHSRVLIQQYADILRIPMNDTNQTKLAISEEERHLALSLYEKHTDAFNLIFEVLREDSNEDVPEITHSPQSTPLELYLGDNPEPFISGGTVPEFFEATLKYLFDHNLIDLIDLPYLPGNSRRRYLISENNIHPNEKEFFNPIKVNHLYMETNMNRKDARKHVVNLLNHLGVNAHV